MSFIRKLRFSKRSSKEKEKASAVETDEENKDEMLLSSMLKSSFRKLSDDSKKTSAEKEPEQAESTPVPSKMLQVPRKIFRKLSNESEDKSNMSEENKDEDNRTKHIFTITNFYK